MAVQISEAARAFGAALLDRFLPADETDGEPPKTLFLMRQVPADRTEYRVIGDAIRKVRHDLSGLGSYLQAVSYAPSVVLCSDGERARHTLEAILPFLPERPNVVIDRALWGAPWTHMLSALRTLAEAPSVLMIGAAPGIKDLALSLARGYGPYHARAIRHRMCEGFPPGGFAALNLWVRSWAGLSPKAGLLRAFVRPSDFRAYDF